MSVISLVAWLVIGGVAGWLASIVMKTNASQGTVLDIIVGIVGAFVGGAVLQFFGVGGAEITGFNLPSLITAFIGAVILLGVLRLVRRA